MFSCKINDQTDLRLLERCHSQELLALFQSNRDHWRPWYPAIDPILQSMAGIERFITLALQKYANNAGFYAGIWHEGRLCGLIWNVFMDQQNRSTALSYWLDAGHQGKGIMTQACSAVIAYSFNELKLNRIAVQCAVKNTRSRAIPERLGFKLEGILREAEWIQDHFVDHAIYSLLKSEQKTTR